MSNPIDTAAAFYGQLRKIMPVVSELWGKPATPLNVASAFEVVEIDLAGGNKEDAAYVQAGMGTFEREGYGLVFLKRGSSPGAMFELKVGGTLKQFGPGDKFTGYFTQVGLRRAVGSATTGVARIMVLRSPLADFAECIELESSAPVPLVGTFDPTTGRPTAYAPIAEDTDPTGVGLASAFDISGWRVIEVFLDGLTNAGNATSFDLVPFVDPAYLGDWHEQGTGRISVPDSDTSGFRFRHVVVNVDGRGLMAYAVRNLLAAARTGLGIAVRGVR